MTIKDFGLNFIMKLFSICPIDKKKVVFESFEGKSFSENPRAIYEQMINSGDDFHYVWLLKDKEKYKIRAKIVAPRSFKAIYHLATAQVWIDNCRKRRWVAKRKEQFYVQTWHGGPMIKKIEADAADKLPETYIEKAKHDSDMADLFLSGSEFETRIYKKAFWYDGNILEQGLPALSMYYENNEKYYLKIVKQYHADIGDHFLLYVPTFRVDKSMDSYLNRFEDLQKALEMKYGGVWRILVRLHPNIRDLQNKYHYDEWVLNASGHEEINDLIMASDIVVSDYSSSMFHAMAAGKKVLIYAADIALYNADRGTYMELRELPFPLAESYEELINNILSFDDREYNDLVKHFMAECGICSSIESAAKVTKYIQEHMYDNWKENC